MTLQVASLPVQGGRKSTVGAEMPFSEDALGNETLWFPGLGCPRGALGKDLSLASSQAFIGCTLSGPSSCFCMYTGHLFANLCFLGSLCHGDCFFKFDKFVRCVVQLEKTILPSPICDSVLCPGVKVLREHVLSPESRWRRSSQR